MESHNMLNKTRKRKSTKRNKEQGWQTENSDKYGSYQTIFFINHFKY